MCAAWETVMRSHAITNGVFVAAVNRTGREGKLEFWGASFVCDPSGNVLARATHDAEQTLIVESLSPERIFDLIPELALENELGVHEIGAEDESLEAVFQYLTEPE